MMISAAAFALLSAASTPPPAYEAAYHDPERAMAMLETLADDALLGRKWGTPGNAQARMKIGQRFAGLGLKPLAPRYELPFSRSVLRRDQTMTVTGTNLAGMIEGTATGGDGPALVITAHYDHVGVRNGEIYNGADDNASGVTALLEVAAWFKKNPPKHDVVFVAFDAEEVGLVGARAFVETPQFPSNKIGMNLNLDMVARADNSTLWAIGTYHFPFLKDHVQAVAAEAPLTLRMGFDEPSDNPRNDWTYLSDQGAFIRAGIPAIYLGVEDHADYHQPSDDAERVDPVIFSKSIDTITMLARMIDADLDHIAKSHAAADDTAE